MPADDQAQQANQTTVLSPSATPSVPAAPAQPQAAPVAPPAPAVFDPYDFGSTAPDPIIAEPVAASQPVQSQPAAGTTAPPPATSSTPAAPTHPVWLRAAAQHHGIEAEAADMSSAELARLVNALDRREIAHQSALVQTQRQQQPAAPVVDAIDEELGISQADLDELHPQLVKAIRHVAQRQTNEIKTIKEQVQSYQQREQQRQADTARERLDKLFDGIADTHGHVFGKGDGSKLSKELRENRSKAVTAMKAFAKTYEELGQSATLDELFAVATRGMFPGQPQQQQPQQPAPRQAAQPQTTTLEQRRDEWSTQGGLNRPTARHAEEPKGTQKAAATANSILRSKGIEVEDDDLNGFPG